MNIIESNSESIDTFPIAVVVSRFNHQVTDKLLASALGRLEALGFTDERICVVRVPGAVEIPIAAQRLASLSKYHAIVALGAVIRGETTHYDYVCAQVSEGCQHVSLTHNVPVVFGVLTTENGEQAFARAGGEHSDKGVEAVDCAIEMVQTLSKIK